MHLCFFELLLAAVAEKLGNVEKSGVGGKGEDLSMRHLSRFNFPKFELFIDFSRFFWFGLITFWFNSSLFEVHIYTDSVTWSGDFLAGKNFVEKI